jgi:hypothetical protein
MIKKEAELVNVAFIKRSDTYNILLGGQVGWNTKGLVSVMNKDKTNGMLMSKSDSRYNVEFFPLGKNSVRVKDQTGKQFAVDTNDPRYLSGELVSIHKNKIFVKDKNENYFLISKNDPRYLSGELVPIAKNRVLVKDKTGNNYMINKDDPRYLSGELVPITTGNKLSKEHKEKISKANKISQSGKRNSQYGTYWICKKDIIKKIKKEELDSYISLGWKKGRKFS